MAKKKSKGRSGRSGRSSASSAFSKATYTNDGSSSLPVPPQTYSQTLSGGSSPTLAGPDGSEDMVPDSEDMVPASEDIVPTSAREQPFRLPVSAYARLEAEHKAELPRPRFSELLDVSYMSLNDAIYNEETYYEATEEKEYLHWRSVLLDLFAGTPKHILKAAIDGTLPYLHLTAKDPKVTVYYDRDPGVAPEEQNQWIQATENPNAPGIYVRFLVDVNGRSPTPNEFKIIVKALRDYVSGDNLEQAVEIDCAFNPHQSDMDDIIDFKHTYLNGMMGRVLAVYQWCSAIELMCKQIRKDRWDEPCPKPRSYTGYSKLIRRRHSQYSKRLSTTWLVLLVEAAFKVCITHTAYTMHTYAIAFLAHEYEIPLAERALTRCLNSKVQYGGFCVVPAGQCDSAYMKDMGYEKRSLKWEELQTWRAEHTDYERNCELEAYLLSPGVYVTQAELDRKSEKYRKKTAALNEEIERLNKENLALLADLDLPADMAAELKALLR